MSKSDTWLILTFLEANTMPHVEYIAHRYIGCWIFLTNILEFRLCNDCLFAWIFKWPWISLCYKRYRGTNTSFIFCSVHSIAKPLIYFTKCLTIKLFFTSQKNVFWRNWKLETFFPCIKNSISDSVSQYRTLFQIEMASGIFSMFFWILC